MRITDIVKITNGHTNTNYIDKEINEIRVNSKEIRNKDVFMCINSGINYIDEAINNGAIAVITDVNINNPNILVIYVDNIINSLGLLATYLLNKFNPVVIAITGSNGKTTTKELISHILATKYKILKNEGSENNSIGVPKALLKLNDTYDYVVLELGMNHEGEIEYLSKMIKPNIGIITNIGTAHIGHLGSMDNIFKAKLELLLGNSKMKLYINGNDNYLVKLNGIKVLETSYNNTFYNKHCPINYALATKVCEDLGIELSNILNLLNNFQLPKSRMREIKVNNKTIIDDSYNASYESVLAGITSLNKMDGRKIVILGDILELGEFSNSIHKNVISMIETNPNTILFTLGSVTRNFNNNNFSTLNELLSYLKDFTFLKDDIIYLKGSNKMKLFSVVEDLIKLLKG